MSLAWDASSDGGGSGLARYEVSVNGELDHTVAATTTETTVTDLAYDRLFEFDVVAIDGAGNRSDPATVEAWTESAIYDPPPVPPTSVTATAASGTSVTVEWVPADELDPDHAGWTVFVDGSVARSVETATTRATVTGLAPGRTYEVGVGARDESGTRSQRATAVVTIDRSDPRVEPVAGSVPTDPDGDGRYEDLNGNGRLDSDDVVTYFEHMDSAAITDDPGYYDYNGNGRIDFDDLVTLFESL